MRERKVLDLACHSGVPDRLRVDLSGSGETVAMSIGRKYVGHNINKTVYLDRDRARELFNALGIWLHKGPS